MTMEAHTNTSDTPFNEIEQFKADVLAGLSLPEKELSAEYCYDQIGTELLEKISKEPDAYPTSCETEILNAYKDRLASHLHKKPFNLIELGPGIGINSKILMEHFLQDSLSFTYNVIDSSKKSLDLIADKLQTKYSQLKCNTIHINYLLQRIPPFSKQKNVILFLNSNIGKIPNLQVSAFLKQLRRAFHSKDELLIGFDLRKNIDLLLQQYNKPNGLYSKLYLNLLERMNRDLGGNFNIEQFIYAANYNNDMESINHFLISKGKQSVYLPFLKQSFDFGPNESIYLGSDAKFREQQIVTLAETNGFEIVDMFSDKNNQFIDSLWTVEK
jgi:L-histidine N-alpha-methyltransferase